MPYENPANPAAPARLPASWARVYAAVLSIDLEQSARCRPTPLVHPPHLRCVGVHPLPRLNAPSLDAIPDAPTTVPIRAAPPG
jgi:hypothetical protein